MAWHRSCCGLLHSCCVSVGRGRVDENSHRREFDVAELCLLAMLLDEDIAELFARFKRYSYSLTMLSSMMLSRRLAQVAKRTFASSVPTQMGCVSEIKKVGVVGTDYY